MNERNQDHRFTDFVSDQYRIEARARALQGETTVRFLRKSAEAIGRAFRH